MWKWSLALIFILCLLSYLILSSANEESAQYIEGEKGVKTANISLREGEYRYNLTIGNQSDVIVFEVIKRRGCTFIDGGAVGGCAEEQLPPEIFMFREWMLYLKPGMEWEDKVVFNYRGFLIETEVYKYRVEGVEKVGGRESYKVKVIGRNGNETLWIDKEERILVRAEGLNYTITLAQPRAE